MSDETKNKLNSLPRLNRQQVEKVMMRYASKHADSGILPQELDPVYNDVIEAVRLQSHFPNHQIPIVKTWEQARVYSQFIAPEFEY